MCGLAVGLMLATFVVCLIFPPAAAVMVPLCTLIWIVAYLGRQD